MLASVNIPTRCSGVTSYWFFKGCWTSGHEIDLEVPSGYTNQAAGAVDQWNFLLSQDASSLTFKVETDPGEVIVTVNDSGRGSEWCGEFGSNLTTITMMNNCNGHHGSFEAAFLNETAGILGWDDDLEARAVFTEGLTTQCVNHIPKIGTGLNSHVCAQEADGVIRAYRGLDQQAPSDSLFWADSIYMHALIKVPQATVAVGSAIAVVADTFYSGVLGQSGNPELNDPPGVHIPIVKPTYGQVSYSSGNESVLSHQTGGTFLGVAAGTTYVHARPSASASTRTRWWIPFKERGDSVRLVVIAPPPPPPPPYLVTSDQTPIWSPGMHTFTAHIGNPSSTIYWRVDDSRTISIDPDTTFTSSGQQATLYVEGGTYTLRFGVRSQPYGSWGYQDIPVCTEPGQQSASHRKRGGAGTNAVEHCPPPPGGGEQ